MLDFQVFSRKRQTPKLLSDKASLIFRFLSQTGRRRREVASPPFWQFTIYKRFCEENIVPGAYNLKKTLSCKTKSFFHFRA
jgi:hypothetical protein